MAGPESSGRPWEDFLFDLRVDDSPEPVKEMRRLVEVARAYRAMDAGDNAIEEGDFERAGREYGAAAELAPGNPEVLFWHAVSLANDGRMEDAVEVLARVYEMDPVWRELPRRLVEPEILIVSEHDLRRMEEAGR